MKHLYAMYGVEQSITTPYNPCGNTTCERFNCTMMDLLKSLSIAERYLATALTICNICI